MNVHGNHGNDQWCTAAGFFTQFGYGSMYFNTALSVYFYLVVVRGFSNADLKRARPWLFAVPFCLAIGMALAGLHKYEQVWLACWIRPYPFAAARTTTYMGFLPIMVTAAVSTIFQFLVYYKVRRQVRKSLKWTFRTAASHGTTIAAGGSSNLSSEQQSNQFRTDNTSSAGVPRSFGGTGRLALPKMFANNVEAAVFWQSLAYLTTFYCCWVVMAIISENAASQRLGVWIYGITISALPGFFNFLVYIRPRIVAWAENRRKIRESQRQTQSNANSNYTMTQASMADREQPAIPDTKVETHNDVTDPEDDETSSSLPTMAQSLY